jgi:4-hydroxy-2-oxoheptanedioate aldolase
MMGLVGFDFVVIDLEHEPLDERAVAGLIRAADGAGLASIVRMPYSDRIQPFLTAGARGVQIPNIGGGSEAAAIVNALRPPPTGSRPYYTQGRSADYGLGVDDRSRLAEQDSKFVLIGMVETLEAVQHLDEILAVDGIDVIHVGPLDLAQSMGFPPTDEADQVINAIVSKCLEAGKQVSVGVVVPNAVSEVAARIEQGVSVFTVATAWMLADAVARFHREVSTYIPLGLRSKPEDLGLTVNPYLIARPVSPKAEPR